MARPLTKTLLLWTRTLHIYVTMLGLIILMFFAFTGLVLNHKDWFNVDKEATMRDSDMMVPKALVTDKTDNHQLRLVEYLRAHGARGAVADYADQDEESVSVQFREPAVLMQYDISRSDGKARIHEELGNLMAVLGELHKGAGSGAGWSWVIDLSAIFMLFASVSGVVLWIALPKRRVLGIISLVVGTLLCVGVYYWLVP